ncbi:MAG TPA: NRDE family protein, partial [Flavisolibacter sp.]|nr:NRDE family protein [Flavisolibacter sp.]
MCTVSFIPTKDCIYFTSSRDEHISRKTALQPRQMQMKHCSMILPTDGKANGTWIGICDNGNAAILLNGAFENHEKTGPYKKSRGLIFLDILDHSNPLKRFLKISLAGIEPFTIIIWQNNCLYECRWDGQYRYCRSLPVYRPHIWSSATLYDLEMRKKRNQWFSIFLNNTPYITQTAILEFHLTAGSENPEYALNLNRDQEYRTVSLSSI